MQRTDSRRARRMADQIMQELASILITELEDPGLEDVSVTGVRVNPNLQVAEMLYSTRGGPDSRENAALALERAKGLLRRELSKRLKLRKAPELRFTHDDFLEDMVYAPGLGKD